jgi:hypothetical protein
VSQVERDGGDEDAASERREDSGDALRQLQHHGDDRAHEQRAADEESPADRCRQVAHRKDSPFM